MKIENLLRPNIRKLVPYSSARSEYSGRDVLYLDANESPFNNGVNRYPDPYQTELKAAIAEDRGVRPDQLFIGNGSDETLDLLFRAFCEPGKDNIIATPPTYGMYKVLADINGVEYREAPLNEDFSLNVKSVLNQIDENTKLIFICSPNNPTGNCLEKEKIEFIAEFFTGILVIDEAYIDFSEKESFSKGLVKGVQLFVNQTLSKSNSGAGLRVGVGIANPEIIAVLNRIKPPYNINTLAQVEALKLVKDKAKFNENLAEILAEKQRLFKGLNALTIVSKIYPSDANFWLVKFENANGVYEALKQEGIIVRNRSKELHCENCLRITIGSKTENDTLLEQLIKMDQKTTK